MSHHAKDSLIPSEPVAIVFHHGTNCLVTQSLPDNIANNIIALATTTKLVPTKFSFQVLPRETISGTTKEGNTDIFLLPETKLDDTF